MLAPYIRIVLRMIAGYFILKGVIPKELGDQFANDPYVLSVIDVAIGAAISAIAEGWYWLAKKFGWAT